MRALVIHESLTGNTREAAKRIVEELIVEGWEATDCSSDEVHLPALQAADVLVVGSWVDGLFFFGQRPGGAGKLSKLPLLGNKTTYVYVTFALDPGKTLAKLTSLIEDRDGDVVGGMTIRRNALAEGSVEFARRVVDAARDDVVSS